MPRSARQSGTVLDSDTEQKYRLFKMIDTRPPGPKGVPIAGSIFELARDPLDFFCRLGSLGPITTYRIGRSQSYLINHPDYIQQVLVGQRDTIWKEAHDMKWLGRFLGIGLLTSDGEYHRRQRRLVQPAFHYGRIQNFGKVMVEYTTRALDQWRTGEIRDIDDEMSRLTMAIVGKTLFGTEVDDATMHRVSAALDVLQRASADVIQMILALPEWLPLPSNIRVRRATASLDAAILPIIAARRTAQTDSGDLLSMLLLAQDEENGQGMTDRQVRDETITIFLAGHETTANALTWALYLLSQHPEAVERLETELDQVLAGRAPTLEDLPELRYTEMVVKETLRLYPPAWILATRQAQSEVEVGGYRIPKSGLVLISPYVMHRHPGYFPDPERFDPERFSPERERSIPKYAHIPFGAGAHVCIGNSFALMEARLLLATIIQRYRLSLAPGQVVEKEPLITLGTKHGMRMRLETRVPGRPAQPEMAIAIA